MAHRVVGLFVGALFLTVVLFGCEKKSAEIPTDLNKELPPPPVAGGAAGKAAIKQGSAPINVER